MARPLPARCGTTGWTRWNDDSTSWRGHERPRDLRADGRQAGGALRARAAPPARRGLADGHRPAELAHWFPCEVRARRAARAGAPMRFVFDPDFALDGEVLECDPPERFSLPLGRGRPRLHARGARRRHAADHAPRAQRGGRAGGRQDRGGLAPVPRRACATRLDGGEPDVARDGRPTPEWSARYEEYRAAGVPSGARSRAPADRGRRPGAGGRHAVRPAGASPRRAGGRRRPPRPSRSAPPP